MEAFFTGVQTNDVYRFKAKTGTTNLVGVAKKTNGNTAVVFFYKGEGGLIHPKDGAATCTIDAAQKKITVRTVVYTISTTPSKITDSDDLSELSAIWTNVNNFVAEKSTKDLDAARSVVKDFF